MGGEFLPADSNQPASLRMIDANNRNPLLKRVEAIADASRNSGRIDLVVLCRPIPAVWNKQPASAIIKLDVPFMAS